MNLYQHQFSIENDFPLYADTGKTLVIASTGRSGSHMLCHVLHGTKYFGFPLEYVNPLNFEKWKVITGKSSFSDVLKEIMRRRTSPNGVFGIKIHYSQIKHIGGFHKLEQILPNPRYVLLSRNEVLKQAISLSIARQTGVFIAGQQPTTEKEPKYSFEQIDECLRKIILDNASWRYMLASNGCKYIEISFECLQHNMTSSIKQIANLMGESVDLSDTKSFVRTKKQSGELNKKWERKFLLESNAKELFPGESKRWIDKVLQKLL